MLPKRQHYGFRHNDEMAKGVFPWPDWPQEPAVIASRFQIGRQSSFEVASSFPAVRSPHWILAPAKAGPWQSSQAIRHGIELDSYRAEAAARVLDHVIQGDALSAHSRVESFGLAYCNPPFDAEFGESGNQRFEVLFLSHFARWLAPAGVLIYILPAPQLLGTFERFASGVHLNLPTLGTGLDRRCRRRYHPRRRRAGWFDIIRAEGAQDSGGRGSRPEEMGRLSGFR
jgi:hypothetical protein